MQSRELLGGLAIGEHPPLGKLRVGHAPTDGGVPHRLIPHRGERLRGFLHHIRSATHRFDSPRQDKAGIAGFDGPRSLNDRFHRRAAEPVDRHPRHRGGKARQQGSESSHVAIVLPCLVCIAEDHVFDPRRVQPGALHECSHDNGGQIIRAHRCVRAPCASERRTDRVIDVAACHISALPRWMLLLCRPSVPTP